MRRGFLILIFLKSLEIGVNLSFTFESTLALGR